MPKKPGKGLEAKPSRKASKQAKSAKDDGQERPEQSPTPEEGGRKNTNHYMYLHVI